ncbi:MAG: hypothetical protein ACI85O_001566 [Saprospiraceae bacterium]|jgi:hypothetical protein
MKKSTLILLLLFLASGAATVWYLKQPEAKKTTMLDAEADFRIQDIDQIGKIFLASRIRGTQFVLERKEDNWYVNDTIPVYPEIITNLMTAIRTMKIKYRPAKAAINNIVKELAVDQVKTEIYDREGNLMKAYYVGGETSDARGTYVIMEGSEKPMVMQISGVTGSFKVRYDLGILDIMDKAIFREDPEQIEYVSIEYPKQRNKSFELDLSSGKPVVTPFHKTTPRINTIIDAGQVQRYLQNFEKVIAESLVRNENGVKAFDDTLPFCTMKVRRKNGTTKDLIFYPRDTQDIMTGNKVISIEKFALSIDGAYEIMHLAQLAFTQKLFIGYDGFF